MAWQQRDILERAAQPLAEEAAKADALVDEALAACLDGSHPVTVQAKMLRLELLKVKADLERNWGSSCSTVRTAARRCIGLPVSVSRRDIGRTQSRRRITSPPSDPFLQDLAW